MRKCDNCGSEWTQALAGDVCPDCGGNLAGVIVAVRPEGSQRKMQRTVDLKVAQEQVCPHCGTKGETVPQNESLGRDLVHYGVLAFPLRHFGKRYECLQCHYRWNPK
jgi:RecJ-like exonuclease